MEITKNRLTSQFKKLVGVILTLTFILGGLAPLANAQGGTAIGGGAGAGGVTSPGSGGGGSRLPTINPNGYTNSSGRGTMYYGLPVDDDAILPNIIYPYLPAGGWIDNLNSPEIGNAPNIGAVEKIVLYLVRGFTGKNTAKGSTEVFWGLTISFVTFGILLSGFLGFQGVSQGKKKPGEFLMSYVMKIFMCVMMLTMITPSIPIILIGLTNVVTEGVSQWFGYSSAQGTLSSAEKNKSAYSLYHSKLAAAHATNAKLLGGYLEQVQKTIDDKDPHMQKVMLRFVGNMKADPNVKLALGWKHDRKTYMEMTWPGIWKMVMKDNKSTQEVNEKMSKNAQDAVSMFINAQEAHLSEAFDFYSAESDPGADSIRQTIASATENIDISGFAAPSRMLQSYAYIAFVYMAIGIWGLGYGGLVWTIIYSMPEEWNLGGVLVSGFKAGLAVVLSGMLIGIYLSAGLVFSLNQDAKMIKSIGEETMSVVNDAYSGIEKAKDTVVGVVGAAFSPGDFFASLASQFSNNLMEHFMLGALIVSAPAQAAGLIRGANAIGESAGRALTAGGGAGQGLFSRASGHQHGSSGATAGTAGQTSTAIHRPSIIGGSTKST
jgi:hypothetical protein